MSGRVRSFCGRNSGDRGGGGGRAGGCREMSRANGTTQFRVRARGGARRDIACDLSPHHHHLPSSTHPPTPISPVSSSTMAEAHHKAVYPPPSESCIPRAGLICSPRGPRTSAPRCYILFWAPGWPSSDGCLSAAPALRAAACLRTAPAGLEDHLLALAD